MIVKFIVYNTKIMNKGYPMFKIVTIILMSLMSMYLFTGCVQPDIHVNKNKNKKFWGDVSSADDVNMSDDNLTESEMMIIEDGEENKLERIAFPESEYYRLARTGRGTVKGTIYVQDAYNIDKRVLGE